MPESFVQAYLNHTSIYESPGSFWKWSAYSTISSVLRDRCFFKNGDSYLFSNLYILLLAESGGRKNWPIELSESLVNKLELGYKTLSGHASVQAILDELATSETDTKTGKVIKSSAATLFAPELSAAIVQDPQGLKTLTDIYDYKANPYKHRLRTGPKFDLNKIVFSIFSASNSDMLKDLFDVSVIRGGFLARTLLVVPNETRASNSLMRLDHDKLKLSFNNALSQLRKVSQLNGEFKVDDCAITEYEKWYVDFRTESLKKKDITGASGRIHTTVRKVAMILAANDLTQCVQKRHIEHAIEDCLGLMPNYNLFTMSHAKTDVGEAGGVIIMSLLEAKDYLLSRKALVRANWQSFDVELLEKAILALEEAGMLRTLQMKDGMYYQLTPACLEMIK